MCANTLVKVMVLLEILDQKCNSCGIMDGIGAKYILYLQNNLI